MPSAGNHSVFKYYGPIQNADYHIEYAVIEFFSGAQDASYFKTIIAVTPFEDVAESLVKENEIYRTWVKTYRVIALHEKS